MLLLLNSTAADVGVSNSSSGLCGRSNFTELGFAAVFRDAQLAAGLAAVVEASDASLREFLLGAKDPEAAAGIDVNAMSVCMFQCGP